VGVLWNRTSPLGNLDFTTQEIDDHAVEGEIDLWRGQATG
jgi:hypothetical protein